MESSCLFLAFVLVLKLMSSTKPLLATSLVTDENALLALKNTITSDPYGVLAKNWSRNSSVCSWTGVTCGNKHQRVIGLNISRYDLGGTLPPHLGNLTFLRYFDISLNNLNGEIPSEIGSLSMLRELSLGDNNFAGELPQELGNLAFLERLYVGNNFLSGSIPFFIFNISTMMFLELSSNQFSGNYLILPSKLSLVNHRELHLIESFQCEIPQGLFNISTLRALILRDNQLTGTLPTDLGNKIPNLEWLMLDGNNFKSDSNSEFSSFITSLTNCRHLQHLSVSNNPLINGILPASIGNLSTSLQYLYFYNCNLTSIIPEDIGNLSHVSYLLLHSNRLTRHIPSSICNLKQLTYLHLSNNILEGPIPECLTANLTRSLLVLHLKGNRLNGSIPTTFPQGCLLESLNLDGNNLDGTLPRSMSECRNLQVVDFGNNGIQDEFPFWVETLPDLRVFVLKSNKFHGPILHSSTTNHLNNRIRFPKLQVFDISRNAFTGSLCSAYLNSFRAMKNVKEYTQTTDGTYWFTYYQEPMVFVLKGLKLQVGRILKTFTTIDFSCNKFNGSIPRSIGGLNSLRYLNLSHNSFTGTIPASLGNSKSIIESLDLSSNQLVGQIPWSLTKLPFLSMLNLSRNNLAGLIPQSISGQFLTFDNSSYMENTGLCGSPLTKKCQEYNLQPSIQISPREDDDGSGFIDGFCWQVVVLGYGCGFILGVIMGCVIFRHERTKRLFVLFFTAPLGRSQKGEGIWREGEHD